MFRKPPPSVPDFTQLDFGLQAGIVHLNHGSFGTVPKPVQIAQHVWGERIEAGPTEWLGRRLDEIVGPAREAVAGLVNAAPERLGLLTNATAGVGAFLRSVSLKPGDEIVAIDHVYNAVRLYATVVAARAGATFREVPLGLPVVGDASIVDTIMGGCSAKTRLLVIDHVTSPTALVLPVAQLVGAARAAGIACLIDGAHAPGMLPLDLTALDADAYTGNLHKWCFAPRGSAFLSVSAACEQWVRPETLSHNIHESFTRAFDWQGTRDFSAWGAIPAAIEYLRRGGPAQWMAHNHHMAVWAHAMLCEALGVEPISPVDGRLFGSMATVRLDQRAARLHSTAAALQERLFKEHRIEVPIVDWNGQWFVRLSAQIYNRPEDYLGLAEALRKLCA